MSDEIPPAMVSFRPYLLRALYAWIADSDMTPHLLVDASRPGVQVPASAVSDGKVVLNIAARAVTGFEMGNDGIAFSARFRGVSHPVWVPMAAVLAIYARETGQLMSLPEESGEAASAQTESATDPSGDADSGDDRAPPPKRGSHLRVVK